jgi:hypothetical protein
MAEFAILRLAGGPASSFGVEAGPSLRPVGAVPGRAALTGLIGRMAGLHDRSRADLDELERWQRSIRYAAVVVNEGVPYTDYQNAHFSDGPRYKPGNDGNLGVSDFDPWGELNKKRKRENKQIWKDYLSGHDVLVAVHFQGDDLPSPDEILSWAMAPSYMPYIGRMNCLPAAPMVMLSHRQPVVAEHGLQAALDAAQTLVLDEYPRMARKVGELGFHAQWDVGCGPDMAEGNVAVVHRVSDIRLWEEFCHGGSRNVMVGRVLPSDVALEDRLLSAAQ